MLYGTDIVMPDDTTRHVTEAAIVQRSGCASRNKRRKSESATVPVAVLLSMAVCDGFVLLAALGALFGVLSEAVFVGPVLDVRMPKRCQSCGDEDVDDNERNRARC